MSSRSDDRSVLTLRILPFKTGFKIKDSILRRSRATGNKIADSPLTSGNLTDRHQFVVCGRVGHMASRHAAGK